MHQLAIALSKKGDVVTGTDDEIFEPALTNLRNQGILPEAIGWFPEKIHAGLDAVILGMHARIDNPEIIRAKELNLPIYSFPEYIYEESKQKKRVVVGGSHGKTTTTSMIMQVLKHAHKDFDYLVGARLEGFEQSVNITHAPIIVCEGDEYPASALEKRPKFHFLFPHIAVLTGIGWDHINVFPTYENYLSQFVIFLEKIEPGGTLIYNETDPELKKLVLNNLRADVNYLPYGLPEHHIEKGKTRVCFDNVWTDLQVFGNHNLLNLHAAYLVARLLDVSTTNFLAGISSFTGASKRLEVLGQNDQTIVYRDFAHAPSKAKATIEAVKSQFPDRKLIAVLELHTFSSLSVEFMPHYKGVLEEADEACVFYSHHAMEIKKMPFLPIAIVQKGFEKEGMQVFNDGPELATWLKNKDYKNACLLLMSSGTFDGMDLNALTKWVLNTH